MPTDRLFQAKKLSKRRKLLKKFVSPKNCQLLLDNIPKAGEATHAALAGTFVVADFLIQILERYGPTEFLDIASLNISAKNAKNITEAKTRGLITGPVRLLLSHYFAQQKGFNENLAAAQEAADEVRIARVHAKVFLLAPSEKPIVIETSGNLRASANVEQMSIFCCWDLLRFHQQWMRDIETEPVEQT